MMRPLLMTAIAAALSVQAGFYLLPSRPCDCHCDDVGGAPLLVSDEGASPLDANHIDDRAVLAHLTAQGAALIEQEQTVSMAGLVKQLEIERCQLDLPSLTAAADVEPGALYLGARESVVVVGGMYKCDKCSKWHVTSASGFVITPTGGIVTNYHVVTEANKETLVVMSAGGNVWPVKRVLAASRAEDLAILKVDAEGLAPLSIATSPEAAPVGTPISVISHPARRFYVNTAGIVARYTRLRSGDQLVDAMSITAEYAKGSSGAPVLNQRGEVVGIVKSTESVYYSQENGQQKNLQMVFKTCIPSTSLLKLIES